MFPAPSLLFPTAQLNGFGVGEWVRERGPDLEALAPAFAVIPHRRITTERVWKTLNTPPSPGAKTPLEAGVAALRERGAIKSLQLVQREERESRFYRYRVDYQKAARLMWFDFNDDGKIVSFGAEPIAS